MTELAMIELPNHYQQCESFLKVVLCKIIFYLDHYLSGNDYFATGASKGSLLQL